MRPLCILHANCLDGLGAAAVVRRRVPTCDLLPMQYGDKVPVVEGRELWMVDFGLTLPVMRQLRAQATTFTWIDHHESQLDVQRQLGFGTLDTSECGASLAWRVLFPDLAPPPIIAYIKDKDLWTWALPESRAVAAGLWQTFQGIAPEKLHEILLADPMAMAAIGRPLLAKQQARVAEAVKSGIAITDAFGEPGLRAFAVPCRSDLNETADKILMPVEQGGLGYDLAVMFYRKKDGRWVNSLRSETRDCLKIAVPRGGGGHRQSACFLSKTPVVPEILVKKPVAPSTATVKNPPGRSDP
jgi:hypothetical protein